MHDLMTAIRSAVSADLNFSIQLMTFLTALLVFNTMEIRRPGFAIDKRNDLLLNVAAILIVIVIGEYIKLGIRAGYDAVRLGQALAANPLAELPAAVKIVLAILMTDFTLYWIHRVMHTPVLWLTHSFHHSIKEIWWCAGARTSLTHLVLFSAPQMFIGFYLLRLEPWQLGLTLSVGIVMNLWLHTNVWVNLGPVAWIFITPNYHRVHHVAQGYMNKNLGFVLTIWDRMFGTYADPEKVGKDFPVFAVPVKGRLGRMIVGV